MKIRVFEAEDDQRIVLLLRHDFLLEELDIETQQLAADLIPREKLLLEEQLYQQGIDISRAIPQLITAGYYFCEDAIATLADS